MRYFVAVAEERHFGRAADRLHIAQPSLSHQIRRLESLLGVTLLSRTSRRVELTPAGESLLQDAIRLLAEANRIVDRTRRASADTLRIGFYGTAAALLLPPTLRAFSTAHPATEVTVRELLFGGVDEILNGGVDLAFTRLHPEQRGDLGLELEVLAEEPRILALPPGHPLAERTVVAFAELRDEAFIINPAVKGSPMTRWRGEQRRHGLPARVGAQAASLQELLTLVAAGRGVSLVPEAVRELHPRHDVRYVPVRDADPALVTLAWARATRRPIAAAFAAVAREQAAERAAAAGRPPPEPAQSMVRT